MRVRFAGLVLLLLPALGCDYCIWNATDPACPPPPSLESRICDHLIDCGRFDEADRGTCIQNHRMFTENASQCLRCVESNLCEDVAEACVDAC